MVDGPLPTRLEQTPDYWLGTFHAMASDCEVLVDTDSREFAERVVHIVATEARRIEQKFSRYRSDNVVHELNHSGGEPLRVDDETADLLDFADRCYALSDGSFDVTSGVLRRVWRFDGGDQVPTQDEVAGVLPYIGWDKIVWQRPLITVPDAMQIDLGGIGKEYAVDRAAHLIVEVTSTGVVVNFGGDLAVTGPRQNDQAWRVGVEQPDGGDGSASGIEIRRGGLATSGDAQRFLLKDAVRYSHVLDPRTGWPVKNAPRSVTVVAGTCTEAGLLATLALLNGADAEAFLEAQGARFWCVR